MKLHKAYQFGWRVPQHWMGEQVTSGEASTQMRRTARDRGRASCRYLLNSVAKARNLGSASTRLRKSSVM